jgi:hypothetical protein
MPSGAGADRPSQGNRVGRHAPAGVAVRVAFNGVRLRSAAFGPVHPRVRTPTRCTGHPDEQLQSGLGATPHEFESRILRTRSTGQTWPRTQMRPGPTSFEGPNEPTDRNEPPRLKCHPARSKGGPRRTEAPGASAAEGFRPSLARASAGSPQCARTAAHPALSQAQGSTRGPGSSSRVSSHESRVSSHESRVTSHESRVTRHGSRVTGHDPLAGISWAMLNSATFLLSPMPPPHSR